MKMTKLQVDRVSIMRANTHAKRLIEGTLKNAEDLKTDPDKKVRLEKNECKSCFYLNGRMGGSVMTERPCGICDEPMSFGSTCTDVTCTSCAHKNMLCKHCGGDIDSKNRRKIPFLEV